MQFSNEKEDDFIIWFINNPELDIKTNVHLLGKYVWGFRYSFPKFYTYLSNRVNLVKYWITLILSSILSLLV